MEVEVNVHSEVLKGTLTEIEASSKANTKTCDACVICLDSISERAIASPCKHVSFDFLCLISWLQERPTCPLCTYSCCVHNVVTFTYSDTGKTEILAVDYGWQSPHGCKTYKVPQQQVKAKTSASTTDQPSGSLSIRRPYAWANGRPRRPVRSRPPVSADAALLRRRHIYTSGLYSLHVGTNRLSRFRNLSPQLFSQDEELISRARKWIRRELQVFDFLNVVGGEEGGITRRANNVEFLLEYIVAILKTVDIKGSGGQAEDMLQEFLGRSNTQLFLHELKAWLRSPYTSLEDWDRHVQYAENPSSDQHLGKGRPRTHGAGEIQPRSRSRSVPDGPSQFPRTIQYPKTDRYRPYPNPPAKWRERQHHPNHADG